MSLTVTDLFCGAGGSSIGAEMSGATLQLGLNHWDRAVETHAANFQHADHDCADVSQTDPRRYRRTDVLLASPECTNHSLAKGARRRKPQAGSLFEDGPASDSEQDRSRATMWDVVRFAEAHAYKAIVVENVVDAFKWGPGDDGQLFDAWLTALRALGYEHEIVWLNSMFCPPTPQSRDRMYVVFWRKGIRRPDLRFDPAAWCPACERVVDGRQTWKRPDRRPWGRYGPQYLYCCPTCHSTVFPGATPAAYAIDWALPATRIGDRDRPLAPNTRERIRRGLERLISEPFAIRLTHGGQPKPLTVPLVTLTKRHDMAMVTPVAGNTFERTPGNRARDTSRQPLDTVHGTLDRALVVPPMGATDARDADSAPAPTQTTTTRAAVVLSNMAHSIPAVASDEPAATVTTGNKLGVVEVQRNGGVRSPDDPVHTVRAGGRHHGVVIRNNTPRGDAGQMATPTREPIRALTTRGHQSLLIPYDSNGRARAVDEEPVQTLTTRDRAAVVISDGDIDDCRFRMFALHEIAEAMQMVRHHDGSDYIVTGNKRERMAQYGNAVTPPAMQAIVGRLCEVLA